MQTPKNHLKGYGCYKCGKDKTKLSFEEFLARAKEKHGDKYNYDKDSYNASTGNVTVICSKHGKSTQSRKNHLESHGCYGCYLETRSLKQDNVINKLKTIHGDKYDYGKLVFTKVDDRVIITCKVHGDFVKVCSEALRGSGCPMCNMSSGEKVIYDYLKENNIEFIYDHRLTDKLYRYDFYLPKLNVVIEYDGFHHFKESPIMWKNTLEYVINNDNIKDGIVKNLGIKMLRIKHTRHDDIKVLLDEYFKNISDATQKTIYY